MLKITRIFFVLTLSLGAFHIDRVNAAPATVWPPKTFPISFWCGPPEPYITRQQFQQIADAGFNVVMPPCEGISSVARNLSILEFAKQVGLTAIIADPRMPQSASTPDAERNIKAIVASYRHSPALLGYFLTDEPSAREFRDLSGVLELFRANDPDHPSYINLLPNYASTDLNAQTSQLGVETYEQYVDQFVRTVKPDLLSWDFYSLLANGTERRGFYKNLTTMQQVAEATNPPLPFWQIVQTLKHDGYRTIDENSLRYEAMQTVAYGAKGLLYYTYWTLTDPAGSIGIVDREGKPGPLFASVKKVNGEVKNLETWLYDARVLQTFQTGEIPPDGRNQPEGTGIKVMGKGNLTISQFRGVKGFVYVFVTNRDYKAYSTQKLSLYLGKHILQVLDIDTNRWHPAEETKSSDGETVVDVPLGPAGAVLYRWL